MRILLVEDDSKIASFITKGLKANKTYSYQEAADCFCCNPRRGWNYYFSPRILNAIEKACKEIPFPSMPAWHEDTTCDENEEYTHSCLQCALDSRYCLDHQPKGEG